MKYGYVRQVNQVLLDKYNNGKKLTFMDYYAFQLTSFGLSLFREHLLFNDRVSISQAFMIRCIIEDLAVIRMYDEKDIPEELSELLRGYQFICEYKMYKRHECLDGKIFDLEEMEKNYNDVKDFYYQKFGTELSSKEFKSIVNSKLPFLMENYSFHKLISMYRPELLDIYQYLSIIVHPSELVTNYCYFEIDSLESVMKNIFEEISNIIEKYYPNIVVDIKFQWENECSICFGNGESYSELVKVYKPQLDFLRKICNQIHKNLKLPDDKVCLPEIFFSRLFDELESILLDRAFGLSEIIKCKIKPIFEFFAVFYYTLSLDESSEKLILMEAYTSINFLKILNEDVSDLIKQVYPIYKNAINKDIEFDKFEALIIKKSMPEFLGIKDINAFVFNMIDGLIINVLWQRDTFRMLYEESQALSHGNGYVLASNDGAFMDSKAACDAIDVLILSLIDMYNKIVQKSNSNKMKYDIGKFFLEYQKIHYAKKLKELEIQKTMKKY